MGGGGAQEVKETEYQKTLAKIASDEWQRYKEVYKPLEDKYMASVDKMGSDQAFQDVADDVATSYQKSFTEAGQQQQKQLAAAGVDPSSGKAQAASQKLSDTQASQGSQAQSQGQQSQLEAYTGGLQNVVAMGKGQQTQAINSAQDIATAAQRKANQDAITESQELSIPGALAGAAASYAVNNPDKLQNAWSNISGGKLDTGGTTLDAQNQRQNQLPAGQMYS